VDARVAQGWCVDPWRRYEHRWFSAGAPTSLVRTRGCEARDEPAGEPSTELVLPEVEEQRPEPVLRVVTRKSRIRIGFVLGVAFLAVFLGCVLLMPAEARPLTAGAFAAMVLTLGVLVSSDRSPRRAH
jgi:hypothetical protein